MIWQIHKPPRSSWKCRLIGHLPSEFICKLGHLHCMRCKVVILDLVPANELERWKEVEALHKEIEVSDKVKDIVRELEGYR